MESRNLGVLDTPLFAGYDDLFLFRLRCSGVITTP